MPELKIQKDRVLEAAKSCPDAANVLKALFPEAFVEFKLDTRRFEDIIIPISGYSGRLLMGRRAGGPHTDTAVYLSAPPPGYTWQLVDEHFPNGEKSLILSKI